MEKIKPSIATLGYIGYFPAPGTMGTLVTLPLLYLLLHLPAFYYAGIVFGIAIGAYIAINKVITISDVKDPSEIVIDESVGILFACIGLSCSLDILAASFLLFRFFDILKPCGIAYFEKLPGAWGILIDDIIAGVCANITIRLLLL